MLRSLLTITLILLPAAAAAQSPLAGGWEGEARTGRWPLFFSITLTDSGAAPAAVMHVLGQIVEFTDVRTRGGTITLREGEGAAALTLEASLRDSALAGRLMQRADTLPFVLHRVPAYPAPQNRIEGWGQDLDALATRFLRWDRSFDTAARAAFLELVSDTRARLAELTDERIIVRMAKAIALSGNAHSRLYLLRNRTELRRLPVRVWWFGDELRVLRAPAEHQALLGCRVDAIGGVPARRAHELVAPLYAGTASWDEYMSTYTLTSPETLAGADVAADPDSVVFTVSDCAAPGREAVLRPLPLQKSRDAVEAWWDLAPGGPGAREGWTHVLAAGQDSLSLYLRHPDRHYWFDYDSSSGILYVQYNRAQDMPDGETTAQFGERLLAELERRQPRAFVLDLRFNTGGNSTLAAPLMRALQERTTGIPRWIITGRATFSAGITPSAAWAEAGDVTFVGEPVGDDLDFWSEGGNVRLPYSRLDAHFANGFHSYSTAPCPAGVPCHDLSSPPLTVNVPASATWAEYRAGRDPAMEAVAAGPRLDSARTLVRALVERERVPGLAITVSDERGVLWRADFGFADIELRTAATPETQFRVGSISKLLTVAALMRLVQQGTLDLDTPIARYDPSLPPPLGALTLRQLAGHLGGVRHYRGREFFSTAGCGELREGLEVFAGDTLLAPPGSRYAYTSYGYNLIGATMEAVSGRSFPEIVRVHVLDPLGMHATRPDFATETGDRRRARLYSVSDSAVATAQQDDLSCRWPSGGYLSSTDDLATLGRSMLGTALLDSASVAEVVTLQRTRSGEPAPVGLGWRVSHDSAGRRYLHHGGASNGGRAFLLVYPDERLVVALAGNALAEWGEREALAVAQIMIASRP